MKRSEIYLKAANVIRVNGHNKGDYFAYPEAGVGVCPSRTDSPVCAVGALTLVVTGDPVPETGALGDEVDELVADFAARAIGRHDRNDPIFAVAVWNDRPERTPADVIAAFEQAAREVA